MTDSKASMLMRWKIASRRMPALLTTPSSLPKLSTAAFTIRLAGIASATVSKFATAMLDLLDDFFRGRCTCSRTVGGAAGVVDDDLGAFGRAQQRDLAPDAAT